MTNVAVTKILKISTPELIFQLVLENASMHLLFNDNV